MGGLLFALDDRRERNIARIGHMARTLFTFTDLFAGIGGFRIGLERVGGRCVYSVEKDKYCRKVYGRWFGAEPEGGDIDEIDPHKVPPHHIMAAGFPCQPFSIAGVSKKQSLGMAHGFDCEKQGNLFFRLADVLDARRPVACIFENVKNLKSHDKGNTWRVIRETLDGLDYELHVQVLDAQDFMVPQHRERVIIVGFDRRRIPNPKFMFPKPTGGVLLSSILEDDPPVSTILTDSFWEYLQAYKAKHKAAGNGFGYGMADPAGVTRTLLARYHKDGSEILIPREEGTPRRLSLREAARLMGFPDHLPVDVVSKTQTYKQFGNAVVPNVVEAVGRQVMWFLNAAGRLGQPT